MAPHTALHKDPKRILIGAPLDSGAKRPGCLMGPDAYRTAGLDRVMGELGFEVEDRGNLRPATKPSLSHPNSAVHHFSETLGWLETLRKAAFQACGEGFPVFLGGDHSLSLGSMAGVASFAASRARPLFVLWLDAHPDFHTPDTTSSGNLHGTPLAYICGQAGFEGFPELNALVIPAHICVFGARSIDPAESRHLLARKVCVHDMRAIDENGISRPIKSFLEKVRVANGLLHVSLDVDFLDPEIAPAVGTSVPGGATLREAHLVMELLYDSGLVTSLDLVELNPFLDERGKTTSLMVDLTASLMGRKVFDRPTRSY